MLRIDRRYAIAVILALLAVIGAFAPAAWAQRNKVPTCQQACYDQVACGNGTPYDCTPADRRAISKCLASCAKAR
jgi:hypothetical protein